MNVLELFSGTKSIGKCCDKLGWNSISVDMEKKFNPTHLCNIMDFDYKQYDKDYFSIVWASPPCVEYSRLQNCFINRMRKIYHIMMLIIVNIVIGVIENEHEYGLIKKVGII